MKACRDCFHLFHGGCLKDATKVLPSLLFETNIFWGMKLMKQDYYCLARSATFFSFTTYSVRWMLSFVLSPEERTIDCLSKIAQGKYTAVTSPSFAFVWCFKRNQCSEQLGTGHVWHGSESRICDLVCATPILSCLLHSCLYAYDIIRHTQELAPRDPNVLNWYELTPLFNLLLTALCLRAS